ncbi:hypothetical protein P43SY_004083 [Pythium insidiosum]|uniref:HECT domain-containing protein n=1 Tax=Pythium insidiosum TaxID=114742 RepID=A0AAD5Q7S9_PYTIN|nr:hypothetical protein P43SY_004083 [Pythium insidiosum]
MESGAIYVVSILILAALAIPVVFVCQRRYLRKQELYQELHAPLSDDDNERRLDAALRDAEAAPRTCSACGFENLHRFIFCALCGRGFDTKAPAQPASSPTASALTVRQRRARLRKQWTRRVGADGRAFWFCAAIDGATSDATAVVLDFHRDESAVAETEAEPAPEQQPQEASPSDTSQAAAAAPSLTLIALGVRAAELTREANAHALRLLPPSDADPLGCAISSAFPSDPSALELLQLSQLPFPEKLAIFVTRTTQMSAAFADETPLGCTIPRDCLVPKSVALLAGLPAEQLHRRLRIRFEGDVGIDAGGLYREWFLLMCST